MIEMITERVYKYIIENSMISEGDKVLVAFSGGPDSVCLLNLLYELREKLKITVSAAHLNHGLRGCEADSDEMFCREFCKERNIQFFSRKVMIDEVRVEKGVSCEVAGREARYSFFQELKKQYDLNKIALAHNANDQAETVLLRMVRGTGIHGLCGIRPVRDGIYIRPVLCLERNLIEKYCEEKALSPHIDKSNLENIYTRNKVRLELIPYLRDNFNSDIVGTLNRLSHVMQQEQELIDTIMVRYYDMYCTNNLGEVTIKKEAFKEEDGLLSQLVRICYEKFNGHLKNLEKCHIFDVISLGRGNTGKYIMLPNGVRAYNDYGDVIFRRGEALEIQTQREQEYVLSLEKVNIVQNMKITMEIINNHKKIKFDDNNLYKRYFNYDKIIGSIYLRYRREKDEFNPLGMKGTKSLKKLFIDMKISRDQRDNIPLICFGDDIAWIVGYRVSEKYKITGHTQRVLCINFER
ncbi:tRNA lysidine(34) synthetase TilS [Hathewaya proteolytica]|nr:tRNA lysidine(34) synthetase TilS [Hathewaya proteolytica]